jgi:hypothetical protein
VGDLYDVLEEARKDGCLPGQFFAITDADDETAIPAPATRLQWDVYHIENYLLEPRFILKALREIGVNAFPDQDAVKDALQACARETVPQLIQHKIRVHANTVLVSSINLGCNPERQDAAIAIAEAAERSGQRVSDRIREQLRPEMLLKLEEKLRAEYATDLAGDQWMSRFRGREILRRFVGKFATGIPYEMFREVIISRMRDEVFQPPGMKKIVDTILEA